MEKGEGEDILLTEAEIVDIRGKIYTATSNAEDQINIYFNGPDFTVMTGGGFDKKKLLIGFLAILNSMVTLEQHYTLSEVGVMAADTFITVADTVGGETQKVLTQLGEGNFVCELPSTDLLDD